MSETDQKMNRLHPWLRARLPYLALTFGAIALGLALHWHGDVIPAAARDKLGDALWAVMIAGWVGSGAPSAGLRLRSLVALGICFAVELSQLYHSPVVDALRHTALGHLVLGSGFDPFDFPAYALGVLAVALLERASVRWRLAGPDGITRIG